jgi:GNAT superfamily N-acetyltransferase
MPTMTSTLNFLRDSGRDPEVMKRAFRTVRERIGSEDVATGLRRDLQDPHTAPEALVELTIRTIRSTDVPIILESDRENLGADERWERSVRRRILEGGFGTCFIAATPDDEPAYMQWMFTASDNADVQRHFAGTFPVLDDDTVLLEGAFTPEAHRGKRIMSAAMSRIAERAADHHARYVITFVGDDNIASLKGCARAGFSPYVQRRQNWRMLRQDVTFTPLTSG